VLAAAYWAASAQILLCRSERAERAERIYPGLACFGKEWFICMLRLGEGGWCYPQGVVRTVPTFCHLL